MEAWWIWNTDKRDYVLATERPDRRVSSVPALPHAVAAHTGTGANPAKWETVTVLGCGKYDLLIETAGAKKTINPGDTIEGRRFVRSIVKVFKVLGFIGRKAAAARAKAEKTASIAKGREGRDGTCQICEGRFIVHKGTLVLHGYERPGIGYAVGRCFGVSELTWEVSCDALKRWIGELGRFVENAEKSVLAAKFAKVVHKDKWTGKYEHNKPLYGRVAVYEGEPEFDRIKENNIRSAEARLEGLKRERARQEARLANWKVKEAA